MYKAEKVCPDVYNAFLAMCGSYVIWLKFNLNNIPKYSRPEKKINGPRKDFRKLESVGRAASGSSTYSDLLGVY